ncbi:replicative DNA helicase [Occallatibacter riparius]|uniref:Replicative DNA helicase n=1 Tax=Occallatibacter riparius TaxID=1002689 RepID=A0A9J7BUM9_9BACT|nr:replicative DNA helicase [Occallatibacter riparius]UWZ84709.1 replicative DNA helicase [Occallatibacter riparius]
MATFANPGYDPGLPAAVDAEKTILGAILLDNHAHSEAAEKLEADDFSLDSHKRIYQRMGDLLAEQRPVDIVTLANELAKFKEIEAVGGVAYLASLTEGLPRRPVIEEYIKIVKDKSLLRRLMMICSQAIARAADQSETALEVLGAAEAGLLEVSEKSISNGFQSLDQIVAGSFGSIDNLYKQSREVTGLATDFYELDRNTSGLQKGELVIIAARPSMGKTAFSVNICQNAAVNHGAVVAVFSLEMGKESLLRRMLSAQAWVDQRKLQTGFLGREDHDKLQKALNDLVESRLFIDDTAGISLAEMRAKARRLKQQNNGKLDLIMIDYLQLMSATLPSAGGKRYENRTQEVSAISRGLKALAKELDVPVVALSQLSRSSERRGDDKRPLLSDLRESGSIEQDADVVMFIHREAYYNRDEEMSESDRAKSEIIIAKQRNGPTGTIHLNFINKYTRFDNPAEAVPGE